jgi:hypothetical protein
LEATAQTVINSRAIGPVYRMGDGAIDELVQAFPKPSEIGLGMLPEWPG